MPDDPGLQEGMFISNGKFLRSIDYLVLNKENEELRTKKNNKKWTKIRIEPGFYKDGEFGIRIEDIVQIVKANSRYDFAGRGALTFKTITMCPKQTKLIKTDLLNDVEVQLFSYK